VEQRKNGTTGGGKKQSTFPGMWGKKKGGDAFFEWRGGKEKGAGLGGQEGSCAVTVEGKKGGVGARGEKKKRNAKWTFWRGGGKKLIDFSKPIGRGKALNPVMKDGGFLEKRGGGGPHGGIRDEVGWSLVFQKGKRKKGTPAPHFGLSK